MSDSNKFAASDPALRHAFARELVDDIGVLEELQRTGRLQHSPVRIGVEQEMCLIDSEGRPSLVGPAVLEALAEPHFTTELARFNLELNSDPVELAGACLSRMEAVLERELARAEAAASARGAHVLLTGILPSLRESDIGFEAMAPLPRYRALNDALRAARGSDFRLYIRGRDELIAHHPTVLFEACNTSFQVHYQIDAAHFAPAYNWAQAIAGPVLACATNSPLLLGKRLWRETRIALFHLATDSRAVGGSLRRQRARAHFGQHWVRGTIVDYYRDLVSRFPVLLTPALEERSRVALAEGRMPRLKALGLLNGTVYPWNRPCYGLTDGWPHVRIESRYLPAGPTILDELANAALWIGLMHAMPPELALTEQMPFEAAHDNFLAAARTGLATQFEWLGGRRLSAQTLLLEELLPLARAGLARADVLTRDADRYLGVIEQRVRSGRTGSQWLLDAAAHLGGGGREAMARLSRALLDRQRSHRPVGQWAPFGSVPEPVASPAHVVRVEERMSTDLLTVRADTSLTLVAALFEWNAIRHLPVETDGGEFLGMIDLAAVRALAPEVLAAQSAADVLVTAVPTLGPDALLQEAAEAMRHGGVTSAAVLVAGQLVGIVTERDCIG